jgi:hypothetical protein
MNTKPPLWFRLRRVRERLSIITLCIVVVIEFIPTRKPKENRMADTKLGIPDETDGAAAPADTAPNTAGLHAGTPMPRLIQIALGGYVVGMFVAILYLLIKTWPLGTTGSSETSEFFWGPVTLAADIRLMLIAVLAGALGAYVHLATSFADYAGNERLWRVGGGGIS